MSRVPACPLCDTDGGQVLWRDSFCRVVWVEDACYPGFCRVILDAHVKEMTDLASSDRMRLMETVFTVEAAVREVARPDKINLASLGNVVPHVHWHVIPRWRDDRHFPDAVWAVPRREGAIANPMAHADIRSRLRDRLAALLD
ncbi:MAG TPA: HIT family protein [Thiobacillaceae bacterium]|nr:HIT family protein [Thiobacillaceae bacterium]HNU64806.1 HIT family protein [Thiobacillaceae bacterium]